MDPNFKPKSASVPKSDVPKQLGDIAETGVAQSKEAFEKMNAATTEAASLMKNCYSTAVKGAQDYNNKVIEFTHANANSAYDFVQKLCGVKSPSEFVEISTEHARKQVETLTEQTRQLAALAQQVTVATAEPLKAGFAKGFSHAA